MRQQLESVLSQLSQQDEIVISDDGSTDKTLQIIGCVNDRRIKVFPSTKIGLVKSFEQALYHASNRIIFLADQDDVWLPDKVSKTLSLINRFSLVVSDCKVVDEKLTVINDSFFALRNSGPGLIKNLFKNSYIGCCMAFNREILVKALPFPEDIPMHDWWIGLVSELYGKPFFLEEPLVLYRRYGSNASPTSEKSSASTATKYKWRYHLVKSLIQRRTQIFRNSQC